MSKNTLFGPVVWSLDMRCAYIPIANTTTFLQLGPPSYDHEVYGDPQFMEGCIPINEDMKRLLSNQASFDWEPAIRGSLPSVELHGRGGEISVRLIDCINQGERLPMEEKLHRKQLGLLQTGSELRKLLAND